MCVEALPSTVTKTHPFTLKCTLQGRPVYIQLIGQIDMKAVKACTTEDRMYKFHVQEYERCMRVIMPICSRLAKRQIDQTFGIMDVRGAAQGHIEAGQSHTV